MKRQTIFDHIPKTAGTSIIAAMQASLGESAVLPDTVYPHHVALALARRRAIVAAHMWFFPGEQLAPDHYYATMLREPTDRFLSQYYFHHGHRDQVRRGEVSDQVVVAAVELGIEAYVADPRQEIRRSYANLQALHFAARMCDCPYSLGDADLRDAAIASLEQYDLVGVFSDPQGFTDAYCAALGAPPRRLERLNARPRPRRADLPAVLLQHLHDCNAVDSALYAWAQQRFAARRTGPLVSLAAWLRRRLPAAVAPPGARPQPATSFGDHRIEISAVTCDAARGGRIVVRTSETLLLTLHCHAAVAEPDLTAGIAIRDAGGALVFGTNSRIERVELAVEGRQRFRLLLQLRAALPAGDYTVTLALHKGWNHSDGCYHWIDRAATFTVTGADAADQQPRLLVSMAPP